MPVQLGIEDRFGFRCHVDTACFNSCCRNIDIMLTPCDILRLKNCLDLTSRDLPDCHAVGFAMDAQGMPGVKLATRPGTAECTFLAPEGCGGYSDRPRACRYYALGMVSQRKKDAPVDEHHDLLVKEPRWLGHAEEKEQTIAKYRREQGVEDPDRTKREWRRIVLKKRSLGPAAGPPPERSYRHFFTASYDLDHFRAFVASRSFEDAFDLEPGDRAEPLVDELNLLNFGSPRLEQALYAGKTIPSKADAGEKRAERIKSRSRHPGRGRHAAGARPGQPVRQPRRPVVTTDRSLQP